MATVTGEARFDFLPPNPLEREHLLCWKSPFQQEQWPLLGWHHIWVMVSIKLTPLKRYWSSKAAFHIFLYISGLRITNKKKICATTLLFNQKLDIPKQQPSWSRYLYYLYDGLGFLRVFFKVTLSRPKNDPRTIWHSHGIVHGAAWPLGW